MRYLPESPRFLARHPERWPELAGILRQIGHAVPSGSEFVDRAEGGRERVGRALFMPEFRRDTLALWGAMFACMLAVYTAFNWVPTMMTGAGLAMSVASNGLAAFNLGGVAGAICGGLVIARIGSRRDHAGDAAGAIAGALLRSRTPITPTRPRCRSSSCWVSPARLSTRSRRRCTRSPRTCTRRPSAPRASAPPSHSGGSAAC